MKLVLYLLAVTALGLGAAAVIHALAGTSLGLGYHKLVFRCLELAALVCAYAWLRLAGARGAGAWGLPRPYRARLAEIGSGWCLGVLTLLAVVGGLLVSGARDAGPVPAPGALVEVLAKGLAVGFAVAIVEELWFRGALFTALAGPRGERGGHALVWTSLLFAAVHFVRPDRPVADGAVRWWSGLTVLAGSFDRFADPGIVDAALALLLAGGLLGIMRLRSASVAPCIGMHAGWVSTIYVTRKLTELSPEKPASALAGDYDGVVGWLAAVVFAASAALAYRSLRSAPTVAGARDDGRRT